MPRYYSSISRYSAATIAEEVIRSGQSTDWASRTLEEFEAVRAILEPRGIAYVCDFRGTWADAKPARDEKPAHDEPTARGAA